ncbi:MAG: hypothetical protein P8Y47_06845 [Alphaproteobacteria bacterium]
MTACVNQNANAQLAELKCIWLEQATEDCKRIIEMVNSACQGECDATATAEEVHHLFHDLQGQASLFGYPLVADLSKNFCAYWRQAKTNLGTQELGVASAHVLAIQFIIDRQVEGQGGATGQTITEKLTALIAANT